MSQLKKNKTKKEEGDDRWSNGLPQHVLQMIPERLQISDYQSFGYVCHSWRGAIKDGIATKTCPPALQLPWLLLRPNDCRHAYYIKNIYSFVRDPKIFRSLAGLFAYQNCIGSIRGWLIIAAEHRLNNTNKVVNFFFNPISGARVMLPSQSTIQSNLCNDLFFLKKVVASSDPGAQELNECLVAGVSFNGFLVICKPTDASWSLIDNNVHRLHGYEPRDIEIIDDKLYSIARNGSFEYILEYKIIRHAADARGISAQQILLTTLPSINQWNWRGRLAKDSETKQLLVIMYRIPAKRQSQREGLLRVFKMESSHPISVLPHWEEVVDLGNMMLFLSETSNKSIRDETLGRNCIYFAFNFRGGFGVYNMENRKIKPLGFRQEKVSTIFEASNQTLWFTPYPW